MTKSVEILGPFLKVTKQQWNDDEWKCTYVVAQFFLTLQAFNTPQLLQPDKYILIFITI